MNEEKLADLFIDSAPGVTELDPEIVTEKSNENTADITGSGTDTATSPNPEAGKITDSAGTIYDPLLHETDAATGRPKLTITGKFRKRRGRRKSPLDAPVRESSKLGYREAGRLSAEAVFVFGQVCFGEEWKPEINPEIGLNETEQMTAAWAAYYEQTGMKDPPPWVMLLIAMGAYAGPRLARPKTQSRLKKMRQWIGLRLSGWKKTKKKDDQ